MASLICTLNFKNFETSNVQFDRQLESLNFGPVSSPLPPLSKSVQTRVHLTRSTEFPPISPNFLLNERRIRRQGSRRNDPGAIRFTMLSQGTLIPYTPINTAFLAARMVGNGNEDCAKIAAILPAYPRKLHAMAQFRSQFPIATLYHSYLLSDQHRQEKTYDRLR